MKPSTLFPYYVTLMDDDPGDTGDKGGGGDSGDDKGDDKGGDDGSAARIEAMERAVSLLAQGHTELSNGMASIISKLDSVGQKKDDNGDAGNGDLPDLETMDRKDYTRFILGEMKKVLGESVKPLNDRFSQLDEKIDGQALGTMVKEFQKDHPDFFEWKDEMRALVKENPTLTPARLYSLARSENRAKAEKVDEKYGLNKTKEKRNGSEIPLSLFPRGGSATKGGTGKMTPKEAAEKAWDQVMSGTG